MAWLSINQSESIRNIVNLNTFRSSVPYFSTIRTIKLPKREIAAVPSVITLSFIYWTCTLVRFDRKGIPAQTRKRPFVSQKRFLDGHYRLGIPDETNFHSFMMDAGNYDLQKSRRSKLTLTSHILMSGLTTRLEGFRDTSILDVFDWGT